MSKSSRLFTFIVIFERTDKALLKNVPGIPASPRLLKSSTTVVVSLGIESVVISVIPWLVRLNVEANAATGSSRSRKIQIFCHHTV